MNYRIIFARNNKVIEHLGAYVRRDRANEAFNRLIEENKKIIFPARYINTNGIHEVKYNIVLLKKRENDLEQPTRLPNEYGEYINYETNSKDFYVYNIHSYDIEETFFVYGYDPTFNRKTFLWIYENIVKPKATDKYSFLNIRLYKNKIVFHDGINYDMVLCKNKSDAIRMYNLLEEYSNNNKLKYVLFNGDWSSCRKKSCEIIKEIMSFTHWNNRKITRHCLRP